MLTHHKRLQVYSFLGLLLVSLVIVFFMLRPFFNVLAASFIVTIISYPLYQKILARLKVQGVSAILTIVCILFIILVPLYFVGQMLFLEAWDTYQSIATNQHLNTGYFLDLLPSGLQEYAVSLEQDVRRLAAQATGSALQAFSQVASNIASFVLSFFLIIFTTFYLLKDGHHIKRVLMDISPIANSQENILLERIVRSVNGVVKGSFFVALVQGIIAAIGYWIFGVPNPFLWGAVTVLAAFVPTVGTSLAIIPAVLYLFVTGHIGAGAGMLVWGVVAVGLIDNFIGPKIVGKSARVHPVLILFSILGGVSIFGFLGFLLGPILMAIFVAMVDMYRHDFKTYIES